VALGIRPEHMEDAGVEEATAMAEAEGSNVVEVEAQVIESMGSEKYVYFEPPREQAAHLESVEEMTGDADRSEQDIGGGSAEAPGGNLMVARISAESTAREGEKMRLVIDSSKIHLFDLESEEAIF
jgi:multiple sugar transport system ATP-binding protein